MDYRSFHSVLFKVALLATVLYLSCLPGQSAAADTPRYSALLTADEVLEFEKAARSDQRILSIVGPGELRVVTAGLEPDKAEVEVFLSGKSDTPPARRAAVVVFNPKTNKAAYAVASGARHEIVDVHSIDVSEVPYSPDDVERALALVKASPVVRDAVGDGLERFRVLQPGDETRVPFAAQALPVHSMSPRDPCAVHRCLDLIFRTERGYLSVRAHVDLTAETVTMESGGHHK